MLYQISAPAQTAAQTSSLFSRMGATTAQRLSRLLCEPAHGRYQKVVFLEKASGFTE